MLETLELENFGRHEKLNVKFLPGLNLIIGRNGAGKSTLLSAAAYAITGEALSDSNLQAEVRNGATSAKVRLTMQTAGGLLEIKRSIGTTTKSRVGVKHSSGSSDKAAESLDIILNALNTNVSVIYNNVFARQGRIDKILDLTATTRLKELQQVFNLEQVEQAHKLLGVEVSQYVVTPGLEETLKRTTSELESIREKSKTAESAELTLRTQVNQLSKWANDIVARQAEFLRHEVLLSNTKSNRDVAQTSVWGAKSSLDAALLSKEDAVAKYSDCNKETFLAANAKLESLRKAMTDYAKYQMLVSQVAVLEKELEDAKLPGEDTVLLSSQIEDLRTKVRNAQNVLDGNISPDKDPSKKFKDAVALLKAKLGDKIPKPPEIDQLKLKIEAADAERESLDDIDAVCPTCKRAMDGVDPDHIANEKNKLATKALELRKQLSKALVDHQSAELVRVTEVELELTKAEEVLATEVSRMTKFFTQKLEQFKAELEPLEDLLKQSERLITIYNEKQSSLSKAKASADAAICPEVSTSELEAISVRLEHIRTGIQALRDAEGTLSKAQADMAQAEEALKAKNQEYLDAANTKVADQPTTEDVAQAKATLEQVSGMQAELASLQSEAGQLKAQVSYLQTETKRLSEQLAKEAKDAAWVTIVQQAREALHVSNYPTDVMREYTSVINKRIAYYIDILEAEFKFYLDTDTMGFIAKFPDGRCHEGSRLSGAQRIIAGVCFRLALADTFARSVGFLCLDEPSAYMDPDSIQALQNLFLRLKSFASSNNKQIILITHERAFMASMDHVIEVG